MPAASVAYVSMQPGIDANGVSVSIQRVGDSAPPTTVDMIGGGFDPVAVRADVDDTLLIVIYHADGSAHPGFALVNRRRPPSIVRTVPAAQRTDVALNTNIIVVFTEPMDSASVVNGITLELDGVVVPTTVSLTLSGGGAILVEVHPIASLAPNRNYDLVIASVLNLQGDSLPIPLSIPFTTGEPTNVSNDFTITLFEVVEFPFTTTSTKHGYVPTLRLTIPPGSPAVQIKEFELLNLGSVVIAPHSGSTCMSNLNAVSGETIDVFPRSFGNWPFLYSLNSRQTGTSRANLYYRRDGESLKKILIEGPIVSGQVRHQYGVSGPDYIACSIAPP